jgi:hypothetical protein
VYLVVTPVCQAVVREVHGTLLRRQVAVIETGEEVVEYPHDRRLNLNIRSGSCDRHRTTTVFSTGVQLLR